MLHAAYAACEPDDVSALPAVFASRFGELGLTVSLLESLARKEPLTASGFTHSVHNTQIGLFSIAAKNRRMASALAAGAETFPYAVIEALASIERAGGGPALVVIGDEPLPAASSSSVPARPAMRFTCPRPSRRALARKPRCAPRSRMPESRPASCLT